MEQYRNYGRGGYNRPMNPNNTCARTMPIGMAYVPIQEWGELYEPCVALCQGTAFPNLNLIFCGARGKM